MSRGRTEVELELRATDGGVLSPDSSGVDFHYGAANRESHSGPFRIGLGPLERAEDPLAKTLFDPGAFIGNGEHPILLLLLSRDRDLWRWSRMFQGIANKVAEEFRDELIVHQ